VRSRLFVGALSIAVAAVTGCGGGKTDEFKKNATYTGKTVQGKVSEDFSMQVLQKGKEAKLATRVHGTCPFGGQRVELPTGVHADDRLTIKDDGRFSFHQVDSQGKPPRFVIDLTGRFKGVKLSGNLKVDWKPRIDNVGRCQSDPPAHVTAQRKKKTG
jgi:hypothetical protein